MRIMFMQHILTKEELRSLLPPTLAFAKLTFENITLESIKHAYAWVRPEETITTDLANRQPVSINSAWGVKQGEFVITPPIIVWAGGWLTVVGKDLIQEMKDAGETYCQCICLSGNLGGNVWIEFQNWKVLRFSGVRFYEGAPWQYASLDMNAEDLEASRKITQFKFKGVVTASLVVTNGVGFKYTNLLASTPAPQSEKAQYFVITQEVFKKLPEQIRNEYADVLFDSRKVVTNVVDSIAIIHKDLFAYSIVKGYFANLA